jgi:maltose O-acetyltransferase
MSIGLTRLYCIKESMTSLRKLISFIKDYRSKRYIRALLEKGLTLGKNVFLNDGFFLDPSHCYLIVIDDGVVFGPSVTVLAHDASSKIHIGHTRVGLVHIHENCFIGARSIILPGCTIGENSIVAAGSVVTSNIPENELWGGIPARKLMTLEEYRGKMDLETIKHFDTRRLASGSPDDREKLRAHLAEVRFALLDD